MGHTRQVQTHARARTCGEAIGVVMPPTLQAKAMPSSTALGYVSPSGMFRMTGRMTETQRTAAATLEIHIERKTPRYIIASMMYLGFVPACANTSDASHWLMRYLPRAAAMVKPPRK